MLSRPNYPLSVQSYIHDSPKLMTYPMLFLSIGALALGGFSNDLFLDAQFYGQSLFMHPDTIRLLDASYAGIGALIPVCFI
jgi:hypothetical protein